MGNRVTLTKRLVRAAAKAIPFRLQTKILGLCCRLVQVGALGPHISITYRGYRVFLDRRDWGGARVRVSFALHGEWYHEIFEQRVIDSLLSSGIQWTVVDAGASYGMYSLLAASHTSVAKVVAIEASPITYSYLDRTVADNHLSSRIEVLNAGVSSTSGASLSVVPMRSSEWNKVVAASGECDAFGTVKSVTVDDVLSRVVVSEQTPVFVKMDIEGHEPVAFKGMAKLFRSRTPYAVLFEFHVGLLGDVSHEFADYIFSIVGARIHLLDSTEGKAILLDRAAMAKQIETASHKSHPFDLFNLLITSKNISWEPPSA